MDARPGPTTRHGRQRGDLLFTTLAAVGKEAGVANQTFPLMRRTARAYNALIALHHHDKYDDVDAAAMFAANLLWGAVWADLRDELGLPQLSQAEHEQAGLRALSIVAACEAWRAAPPSDGDDQ